MLEKGFRHLPVVDGETILGIVSLRRIMGGGGDRTSAELGRREARLQGLSRHVRASALTRRPRRRRS